MGRVDSLLTYLRQHETTTWPELSQSLGQPPVALIRRGYQEATSEQERNFLFRSMLLRYLHEFAPNGIRGLSSDVTGATTHWSTTFIHECTPTEERPHARYVCDAVSFKLSSNTDLPDSWLPSSVDEPDFAKFFELDSQVQQLLDETLLHELRKRETATWDELGEEREIDPRLLMRKSAMEAQSDGDREYLMRSFLVRILWQFVPNGIRCHASSVLSRAAMQWRIYVVGFIFPRKDLNRIDALCRRVADALENDEALPDDWLPQSADDPQLLAFFEAAAD